MFPRPLEPTQRPAVRPRPLTAATLAGLTLFAAACSSDADDQSAPSASNEMTTTSAPEMTTPPEPTPEVYLVTDPGDQPDADPGDGMCATADGQCTLRAAIGEANATDGEQTITLETDVTLTSSGADEDANATGDFDISDDVIIDGGGSTVDGAQIDRVFHLHGVAAELHDLTLTNGLVEGEGASGGAVFNDGGDLTIIGSSLTNSSATRAGGAIEANEGVTTLTEVTLSGNSTGDGPGNGGGLHLTGAGSVLVTDSTVSGNTATAEGGGLWNSATGTFEIVNTTINDNVASGADADQGGGGLFNDGGVMTVTDSTIDGNVADGAAGSGGGILNNLGDLTVTGTTLSNNTSVRAGGGIEANEGTTTLSTVTLDANSTGDSPGNGGAVHLTGAGAVLVDDSTVTGNSAGSEGGGLWNSAPGTMTVTGTETSGNQAPVGADVYNDGGSLTVDGEEVAPGQ